MQTENVQIEHCYNTYKGMQQHLPGSEYVHLNLMKYLPSTRYFCLMLIASKCQM